MAIKQLDATVTKTSNIISISVSDSHTSATSTAQITAVNTTLDVGDLVEVDMGYEGDQFQAIKGYVKEIEETEPEHVYNITIANVMIRAVDYFIASSTPTNPFTRRNISAENLVRDVIGLSGLNSFASDATGFTFAVHNPVEINLTSAFDYARFISDILAYNLYADASGTVQFRNRRPYPLAGDGVVATISSANNEIISVSYEESDRDIRNKVIVYGSGSIHASAQASSPYLPSGYFRTVVVAAPGVIDTQSMADQSASYNLSLLNRLTKRLSVSILGRTGLFPRSCITVDIPELGLNSEKWYMYAVEHSWSNSGYITNLELRK